MSPSAAHGSRAIAILVFARVPEPGKVKTRLAASIGVEDAARLAHAFLRDTCAQIGSVPWARMRVATTGRLGIALENVETWDQGDGDLGARLVRMLGRALEESPAAFAIGADSPGLPIRLLEQARAALETADAVLGPCDDGGFYLIGVRRCPPGLLDDIPWSREDTFDHVRSRLEQRGLSVAAIEPWFDVDRADDLERLHRALEEGAIAAPATHHVLSEISPLPRTRAHP